MMPSREPGKRRLGGRVGGGGQTSPGHMAATQSHNHRIAGGMRPVWRRSRVQEAQRPGSLPLPRRGAPVLEEEGPSDDHKEVGKQGSQCSGDVHISASIKANEDHFCQLPWA